MPNKIDEKTLKIMTQVNEVNKRKLAAKMEIAKARLELISLKEELIKSGNLNESHISFILTDVNCW